MSRGKYPKYIATAIGIMQPANLASRKMWQMWELIVITPAT